MVVIEEEEAPQVEVTDESSSDSDRDEEDMKDAKAAGSGGTATGGGAEAEDDSPVGGGKGKQSRNEKKSRKLLLKHGLKPVPGIMCVTIRKSATVSFVVRRPDVYKSPCSDTYIIFGEAKVDDVTANSQSDAAQRFTRPSAGMCPGGASPHSPQVATTAPVAEPAEDDEDVDTTGVEEKDIDLVQSQVNCSRSKAVKALRENSNDIVEAIMQLSSAD
eukprot:GHVQ01015510.1.p1 GENE.GHVQ01015510.1~~GHVQ01015510.1.p1  ORF type:complete len:255 (+),score=56.00 GHVQ01015510.1:116-766(+)